MQAVVLNTLTESRQFNKVKISKRAKEDKEGTARALVIWMLQQQPCQYCGRVHPLDRVWHMGRHVWGEASWDISEKYATAEEGV